jgi:hypothetical protein
MRIAPLSIALGAALSLSWGSMARASPLDADCAGSADGGDTQDGASAEDLDGGLFDGDPACWTSDAALVDCNALAAHCEAPEDLCIECGNEVAPDAYASVCYSPAYLEQQLAQDDLAEGCDVSPRDGALRPWGFVAMMALALGVAGRLRAIARRGVSP